MIRVGILGRTPPERSQLRRALDGDRGVRVAGEGRPDQAAHLVRALRPQVLVSGHGGPEDALGALRADPAPGPARIVVLGRLSEHATRLLLRQGVRGVLLRADTAAHLTWAVRAAAAGSLALAPGAAGYVVEPFVQPGRPAEEAAEARRLLDVLSVREREILELLGEGASNAAVAARLGISGHTVKDHVRAIYTKLMVRNRIQAAHVLWRARVRPAPGPRTVPGPGPRTVPGPGSRAVPGPGYLRPMASQAALNSAVQISDSW